MKGSDSDSSSSSEERAHLNRNPRITPNAPVAKSNKRGREPPLQSPAPKRTAPRKEQPSAYPTLVPLPEKFGARALPPSETHSKKKTFYIDLTDTGGEGKKIIILVKVSKFAIYIYIYIYVMG